MARALGAGAAIALGLFAFAIVAGAIVESPAIAIGVIVLGSTVLLATRTRRAPEAPGISLSAPGPAQGPAEAATGTPGKVRPSCMASWLPDAPTGPKRLPIILGEVGGRPRWLDMATAPHVLVGGSTGSGKSTFLHAAIVTGTALTPPDRLRLVLIDPKRVELNRYRRLPHLAAYASENADAQRVLVSVEREMDRRYRTMDILSVRDVSDTRDPRVLVVIDEFADLILTTRKTPHELEGTLSRLLALGRAAGIHVILATQRPDAKVVTGLIKANAPTRIAFRTSNGIESRIILDAKGAEGLPGAGAGLIMSSQVPNTLKPGVPVRFQGFRIPDDEIDRYTRG